MLIKSLHEGLGEDLGFWALKIFIVTRLLKWHTRSPYHRFFLCKRRTPYVVELPVVNRVGAFLNNVMLTVDLL